MINNLYVQYGCAWCAPERWLNFDASPTFRLERIPVVGRFIKRNPKPFPQNVRYGDILRGLPLEQGSCKCIYCCHVLEHLSYEDLKLALRNTFVLLKENGIFRFVGPDLRFYAARYVNDESAASALEFMKDTGLGQEKREKGLREFIVQWFGNTRHRWMWDYPSLEEELIKAGFRNIRRAYFNDSEDPMFLKVEEMDRWENCLGVECVK
jgi:SAM-dependent methyltransferase